MRPLLFVFILFNFLLVSTALSQETEVIIPYSKEIPVWMPQVFSSEKNDQIIGLGFDLIQKEVRNYPLYSYNFKEKKWIKSFDAMLSKVHPETYTLLSNGKILVTGSENRDSFLLDLKTGSLTETGKRAFDRNGYTATLLNDGRVLLAGGHTPRKDNFGGMPCGDLEIFDPTTNQYTPLTAKITPRSNFHKALRRRDGSVIFLAGLSSSSCCSKVRQIDVFEPITRVVKTLGIFPEEPDFEIAELLEDGKIFIYGGSSNKPTIYDPETNKFTKIEARPECKRKLKDGSRYNFEGIPNFLQSAVLENGEVLIIAGRRYESQKPPQKRTPQIMHWGAMIDPYSWPTECDNVILFNPESKQFQKKGKFSKGGKIIQSENGTYIFGILGDVYKVNL